MTHKTNGSVSPGERGYEIRASADGRTVFLAGADPIGALYACVTFGDLLRPPEAGRPNCHS